MERKTQVKPYRSLGPPPLEKRWKVTPETGYRKREDIYVPATDCAAADLTALGASPSATSRSPGLQIRISVNLNFERLNFKFELANWRTCELANFFELFWTFELHRTFFPATFKKMLHFGKMQHFGTPQGTVKVRKLKKSSKVQTRNVRKLENI